MFWRAALAACGLAIVGCSAPPAPDIPTIRLSDAPAAPALASVAPSASALADAPRGARSIAWEASEVEARARARARKAPLLVFFCAAWAAAAVRMDRATWSDPRVVAKARAFVALRLDATETDANAQAAADRFDLRTMPSVVFLDDAGHEIARLEGLADPEAVLAAMERASSSAGD